MQEETVIGRRKRSRRSKMRLEEIIDMLYQVFVGKELMKDVAKMFRVTPALVSKYVAKARRNPEILSELVGAREDKKVIRERIANTITEMNLGDIWIASSSQVVKHIQLGGHMATEHLVQDILKKDMGYSYRKVVKQAWRHNSEQNRVLR